jgi:hemerythrin-like domain-containing protein
MATTTRSKRGAKSRGRKLPDALQLLKDDHERVKSMFDDFRKAESPEEKEQLAERICEDLSLHAELEDTCFYPAIREAIEEEELVNEADVEHATAKDLIAKVQGCDSSDQHFSAMVNVLGEVVKHHIEEEEREIFKQVKNADLDLDELAERMAGFKRDAGGGEQGERAEMGSEDEEGAAGEE